MHEATKVSSEYPVIVSKFFNNAKEIELDAVAQNGDMKAFVIAEHVENAGVHSGDATIILPTQKVNDETKEKMIAAATDLAKALDITGPFNIQFLAKEDEIYILEINLRASRTFPFIAKVTGVNMIDMFVDSLFKKEIKAITIPTPKFVAVKVAQFSFARLTGANPNLGVEMASTGEVACFGEDTEEAFLKGILATGGKIPEKGIFISIGGQEKKDAFLESARRLATLRLPLYATENTAKLFNANGIKTTMLYKLYETKFPNILEYLQNKKLDLVINIVDKHLKKEEADGYKIRRIAVDNNILVFTKLSTSKLFAKAVVNKSLDKLTIKAWGEY